MVVYAGPSCILLITGCCSCWFPISDEGLYLRLWYPFLFWAFRGDECEPQQHICLGCALLVHSHYHPRRLEKVIASLGGWDSSVCRCIYLGFDTPIVWCFEKLNYKMELGQPVVATCYLVMLTLSPAAEQIKFLRPFLSFYFFLSFRTGLMGGANVTSSIGSKFWVDWS